LIVVDKEIKKPEVDMDKKISMVKNKTYHSMNKFLV
jgi:hypothetical protein